MATNERLDQIQVKVRRAIGHYADMQSAVRSYLAEKPYTVGTRHDPDSRCPIYFVSSVEPVPPTIAAVLGDTMQNLRSSLDHLAYQLVFIGTGKPPSNHVYFPIADDTTKYGALRRRQIKGAKPQAIAAIDALKPYRGGNDTLWKLHKLNNVDKHRMLITAGSVFQSINLGSYMFRMMQRQDRDLQAIDPKEMAAFYGAAEKKFPLKAGDELFIGGPAEEIDEALEFRFGVVIAELGIALGEPLLEAVKPMVDLVEHIVSSFEPMLR